MRKELTASRARVWIACEYPERNRRFPIYHLEFMQYVCPASLGSRDSLLITAEDDLAGGCYQFLILRYLFGGDNFLYDLL